MSPQTKSQPPAVITVLHAVGYDGTGHMLQAKKILRNGRVVSAPKPSLFRPDTVSVADMSELYLAIVRLSQTPAACVIRGAYVGDEKAEGGMRALAEAVEIFRGWQAGLVARRGQFFNDVPTRWMCIDVDKFKPTMADPVHEPEAAVREYLECLPPAFNEADLVWQLSARAGTKGEEGVLRAHLWFLFAEPYTSAQLKTWSRAYKDLIDISLYQQVQPHYTANPILERGAVDPVPHRICLSWGL